MNDEHEDSFGGVSDSLDGLSVQVNLEDEDEEEKKLLMSSATVDETVDELNGAKPLIYRTRRRSRRCVCRCPSTSSKIWSFSASCPTPSCLFRKIACIFCFLCFADCVAGAVGARDPETAQGPQEDAGGRRHSRRGRGRHQVTLSGNLYGIKDDLELATDADESGSSSLGLVMNSVDEAKEYVHVPPTHNVLIRAVNELVDMAMEHVVAADWSARARGAW